MLIQPLFFFYVNFFEKWEIKISFYMTDQTEK